MPTWNIRIFDNIAEIEVSTNEGRSLMHMDLELPLQFIEDDESIRIADSNGGFIGVDPENDPGKIIMEAPGGHSWFDIEIPIIEDIVAYVRAGVQREHEFDTARIQEGGKKTRRRRGMRRRKSIRMRRMGRGF